VGGFLLCWCVFWGGGKEVVKWLEGGAGGRCGVWLMKMRSRRPNRSPPAPINPSSIHNYHYHVPFLLTLTLCRLRRLASALSSPSGTPPVMFVFLFYNHQMGAKRRK
jgi:hypothetical protein